VSKIEILPQRADDLSMQRQHLCASAKPFQPRFGGRQI
jgi:hypothetical protein